VISNELKDVSPPLNDKSPDFTHQTHTFPFSSDLQQAEERH